MAAKKGAKRKRGRPRVMSKAGPFYTRAEAAQILGITVSGVRGLEARGLLPGKRDADRWVFSGEDITRAKRHTRRGKREEKAQKLAAMAGTEEGPAGELEAGEHGPRAEGKPPTVDPMVASAFLMLEGKKRPMDLILELHFTPDRARETWEQYRDILALSSGAGLSEPCIRCKLQPACICLECAGPASSRPSSSTSSTSSQSAPTPRAHNYDGTDPEAAGGGPSKP